MGGLAAIGLLLLSPAAPLPAPVVPPNSSVNRDQALNFAGTVVQLAYHVSEQYIRPPEIKDLLEASLRGLYEEAGTACPEEVLQTIRRAHSHTEFTEALAEARMALGNSVSLRGPRALCAAVNGFRYATDPHTILVTPRITTFVSVEMDFGIGMELEGVSGPRWTLYQVELGYATGRFSSDPAIGSVEKPLPPLSFPWRVRRVIPGSPCQMAGMKPGDVVTHMDGKAITAENSLDLFRNLRTSAIDVEPVSEQVKPVTRRFTVRREGHAEPIRLTVKGEPYLPETVFGVRRISQESWDHMLDRQNRIGYIRVGFIENSTDAKVSETLADLTQKDCKALILDLRWCPGGFVDPSCRLAGLFLDEGALITRMAERTNARGVSPDMKAFTPAGWTKFPDRPLVVLVGPETSGGGEMIASALQDHQRAIILGQRTLGKGNVQRTFPSPIGDLQLKISTGFSLRPNGKNRHRFPDSKPTDDWGVRPDVGFEVSVTTDVMSRLRTAADLHALRPFGDRKALEFDDPGRDPHRLMALKTLQRKLKAE